MFDDNAGTEAQQRERLRRGWETWLRSLQWDLFATGTWNKPVTSYMALWTVQRWLARYPTAYAIVGVQRGPVSLTHHVHLLIGGVGRDGVRGSWVTHGHMKVERYEGHRDAVAYLVRQADEIEVLGSPQTFTPKRKRRRRGRRAEAD